MYKKLLCAVFVWGEESFGFWSVMYLCADQGEGRQETVQYDWCITWREHAVTCQFTNVTWTPKSEISIFLLVSVHIVVVFLIPQEISWYLYSGLKVRRWSRSIIPPGKQMQWTDAQSFFEWFLGFLRIQNASCKGAALEIMSWSLVVWPMRIFTVHHKYIPLTDISQWMLLVHYDFAKDNLHLTNLRLAHIKSWMVAVDVCHFLILLD